MHLQIPISEDGRPLIDYNSIMNSTKKLQKQLPRYYKIIVSPFNITTNKKTITIDTNNVDKLHFDPKIIDYIKDMIEKEGYIVKVIK